MNYDIINIKRSNASLNLFEPAIPITNTPAIPITNPQLNIKLLNYQDLFDHIKTTAISNGKYFEYIYTNNGTKVTLYMRSIKSISDYLFRYYNDTNIYCKQDKQNNSFIKIDLN